jgi:hypothetical protein
MDAACWVVLKPHLEKKIFARWDDNGRTDSNSPR